MLLIYLIVNYLYRKYGVPLHIVFENWTRGISHLKAFCVMIFVNIPQYSRNTILNNKFCLNKILFIPQIKTY